MTLPDDRWPLYVLAGGRSSRFGADKALALLDGEPLLRHAIAPFQPLVSATVAVVDRADRLAPLALPVAIDATPFGGPAHGLVTALRHRGDGWLWLAPCDVLGLRTEWLQALAREARSNVRAVAFHAERWQPLPSLWHTAALPAVEAALAAGHDGLWQLLNAVAAVAVAQPEGWSQVTRVDTQEALQRLQRARAAVAMRTVTRLRADGASTGLDAVAHEAPLQMLLQQGDLQRNLGVTLRSPGDDVNLTVGLALAEAAIRSPEDVVGFEQGPDRVTLQLHASAPPPVDLNPRLRVTSAACGACGKSELDVTAVDSRVESPDLRVNLTLLQSLPAVLRAAQAGFEATGALHAAGLFTAGGVLLDVREDIGRHNAVDKLLGAALLAGRLPAHETVLVLSGRAAFELLQKAAVAGVPIVAAVGAPSSLAIDVAQRAGITLLGFVRADRANIYTHPQRVVAG